LAETAVLVAVQETRPEGRVIPHPHRRVKVITAGLEQVIYIQAAVAVLTHLVVMDHPQMLVPEEMEQRQQLLELQLPMLVAVVGVDMLHQAVQRVLVVAGQVELRLQPVLELG
jgi:hypothetical protein